jgi:hypothetical protein
VQKAYGNEALNRSIFLGGILDFEMEESWKKMMREVHIAAAVELVKNDR